MKLLFSLLIILGVLCNACSTVPPAPPGTKDPKPIADLLDSFNAAAARADFHAYFNFYADDAIFTGTDATERWDKASFMTWAKPYFDKGHAWNFKAIDRHIYFDSTGNLAWFDERLNTQMKICRGSGVLAKQNGQWKLKQYILSTTVPNAQLNAVIPLKAAQEDSIMAADVIKK